MAMMMRPIVGGLPSLLWMTTAPAPNATAVLGGYAKGGHGGNGRDGGDGRETLQEWSSLIGIITAIVGNMLIALALNVQRYAHTRLHKERIRVRQRARAALKRTQSSNQTGTYGTILNGSSSCSGQDGSNGLGFADFDDGLEETQGTNESDPLTASFQSSATMAAIDESETDSDNESPKVTSTYLKSPYWWLGQILITLGEMGNFLAYGFAPASIVSPLGVVALVSNCIIAPVMFHEKFRQRDFWGVVVAVAGAITVVLSAKQEETKLNPHDVWDAITTLEFEVYLGVTILLISFLMWASTRYGKHTILIDLGLVGLFGGYTVLATKGVSSMLSSTLWGAFKTPVTYVLIFILLGTAVMQIRYVNKALQRFDSTQVIPIQFVMFTLCVILGSAILYRDFEKTTAEQAGKFVGGCLLTFFGVFLITSGRGHRSEDDDDDLLSDVEGIEETIGLTHHDGNLSIPAQRESYTPNSQSRRSSKISRVSFADMVKPESSQTGINASTMQFAALPSPAAQPGDEPEPLLSNPWQDSFEAATPPPRGIRTISTDSVLTRSTVGSTPLLSSATTPMREPQAPATYSTDQPLIPRPGPSPSKPGSHHRSRTFISPSPLSSTVTTVFKDAFLRENESSLAHRSSMRRIRSSIRASLFFNNEEDEAATLQQKAGLASDSHLPRPLGEEDSQTPYSDPTRGRSRSLSDTLGDYFRSKRAQKYDEPDNIVDDDILVVGRATTE